MSVPELEIDKARWSSDSAGFWLHLRTKASATARQLADGIDRPYTVKFTPKRERRSLDANAYCWVLINKIAAATGIPPKDIYRQMIPDVGDNCYIYPVRNDAVERWTEIWQSNGVGWVCEVLGDSKLDGYTNVCNYYGSSQYDTAQMSRLIDLVVQECKQLNIETLTPRELALLKEGWDAQAHQGP